MLLGELPLCYWESGGTAAGCNGRGEVRVECEERNDAFALCDAASCPPVSKASAAAHERVHMRVFMCLHV